MPQESTNVIQNDTESNPGIRSVTDRSECLVLLEEQ